MGAWILPAITTGISAIAAARSGRRKGPNIGAINSRYLAMRPGGYLTPEDQAMAERTRTKGVASARNTGALMRDSATRQAEARGLSGASAAALATEAGNTEAAGRESAYGAASDAALGLFGQNRDFEREKMGRAWGAELGAASQQTQLNASREAGLWNSVIGTAPLIANAWGKMPAGVVPSAGAPGQMVTRGGTLGGTPAMGGATYRPGVVPQAY